MSVEQQSRSDAEVKELVRDRYASAAVRVIQSSGCGPGCCGGSSIDPVSVDLYESSETAEVPAAAIQASLGCGNPTALAKLNPGEVVLDLGSGGGIDVLLSAKRVGPTGKAYGLDMTDEMHALARENQKKAGVENVEFLKGEIESIPLPDASVDVIISNCVINLSGDKRKVIAEACRVLKPGGRFAVSDVVCRGEIPPAVRKSIELWVGCIAGALTEQEFHSLLWETGFEKIDIEPTRIYQFEDARAFLEGAGFDSEVLAREVGGRVMGAFIRGIKPADVNAGASAEAAGLSRACCGPDCCA